VREKAIHSLGELKVTVAADLLRQTFFDTTNPDLLRRAAAGALWKMNWTPESVLEKVAVATAFKPVALGPVEFESVVRRLAQIEERNWAVGWARELIASLTKPEDVKALVNLLGSKIDDFVMGVCGALATIRSHEAIEALISVSQDSSFKDVVRRTAIEALGEIKESSSVSALLALIESGGNLRTAAIKALGNIGDKSAVTPLIEVLEKCYSVSRLDANGSYYFQGETYTPMAVEKALQALLHGSCSEIQNDQLRAVAALRPIRMIWGPDGEVGSSTDFAELRRLAREELARREAATQL
jgi:HEAT repeat protein